MPVVRPTAACVAAFIVAAVMGWTAAPTLVSASETPRLVLDVHFTSSDALPADGRRALMAETESIWKAEQVDVRWLSDQTAAAQGAAIRVLVVARPAVSTTAHTPWTVAELLRIEGSRPIAIASVASARRIIDESRRERLPESPALHDHRLGVVLGRAVAHEIGHYLLGTSTHATRGLMRARIDAREFADLRSGTFRLDEATRAHLMQRTARGTLPLATDAGFSYVSQTQ